MRLNLQSDYSLRLLMHLAVNPQRRVTIAEIANRFRISQNHLMKVAYLLGKEGFIETVRGRAGGLQLARKPEAIRVGDVVRRMEGNIQLADCLAAEPNACILSRACRLRGVLDEALDAFLDVLDRYTLADLAASTKLRMLLDQEPAR